MRPLTLALALFACSGDPDDKDTGSSDADADTDADADADTDADTDTDTDVEPPDTTADVRVVHAAPSLPAQDLLGNGVPGNPAMVDLEWLETFPGSGWARRPPNTYTFELFDTGEPTAWISFPGTLALEVHKIVVIHGVDPEDTGAVGPTRGALLLDEQVFGIPVGQARIRWTHVAAPLGSLVFRDAVTAATLATLDYAGSAENDYTPATISPYVDLDGDSACDAGEAFAPFTRTAGDYFHVLLVADEAGVLSLLGLGPNTNSIAVGAPCP